MLRRGELIATYVLDLGCPPVNVLFDVHCAQVQDLPHYIRSPKHARCLMASLIHSGVDNVPNDVQVFQAAICSRLCKG